MAFIDTLKGIKRIAQQNKKKPDMVCGNISYQNWWYTDPREEWFTRFLVHRIPEIQDGSKRIRFYSVFGPRYRMTHDAFDGMRVFYTGENLEPHIAHADMQLRESVLTYWQYRERCYGNYAIGDVDLALGFAKRDDAGYLQFPEWIPFTFSPEADVVAIRERVDEINHARAVGDLSGAVLIATHDDYGTRDRICRDFDGVLPIAYAGKWRNNTDVLKAQFDDHKAECIRHYRFNICPENVDAPYYCTEKIFDAFSAGCIPIYHGSGNDPMPGLINKDAAILWNYDGDNDAQIAEVRRLATDEPYYERFMGQTKLLPETVDYVVDCMNQLEQRIREGMA